MVGNEKDRLQELCELASNEQDHEKLIELVKEINNIMEAKQKRLGIDLPPESA